MPTRLPDSISADQDSQSFNPSDGLNEMEYGFNLTAQKPAQGGCLYIVATPIGNLRDITFRALDILRSVDEVLAEDTRQSRKLLNAYKIKTPLSAFHDHNESSRLDAIIKNLSEGRSFAQISDAGTPLISDPGFKLVRAVIAAGFPVIPLPGASSVLAALVTSGLPSNIFTFGGFLPSKSIARKKTLERFKDLPGTVLFFETGKRIEKSLMDIESVLGDRPAALARELTKKFEETRHGTLSDLLASVQKTPPRGELVIIIGPSGASDIWDEAAIDEVLAVEIPKLGMKRASTEIAERSGWMKRDVYQRALSLK